MTGASGGVGGSLCDRFRAEGASVLGTDLVAADGIVPADLCDDDVAAFAQHAVEELGGVDVRCNVAGMQAFMHFEDMSAAFIGKHFDVNATGPLMLTQALLPALTEAKGNVVSIISISALMGASRTTSPIAPARRRCCSECVPWRSSWPLAASGSTASRRVASTRP
jgi:meso-butanediol dehydrogenase/(S,S)-butanediol dehydrogenase/diacetyl reductase